MRLFIAIDMDENARSNIAGIINRMKGRDFDVKWVEPENVHLTLKFLGEVDESELGDLERKIDDVVKDVKEFIVSISEVGYFGSPGYVKVIWLDVKEGREQVIQLSEAFNRELSHVRRDDFKPSPHLTIGRVRSGKNKNELLREINNLSHVKIGEVSVKEIKLKSSVLCREGPAYSDVKVFALK